MNTTRDRPKRRRATTVTKSTHRTDRHTPPTNETHKTQNREVREKLYRAFVKRASEGEHDNAANVQQVRASPLCVPWLVW